MTIVTTSTEPYECVTVYNDDGSWFMSVINPQEVGHMQSHPIGDNKAVYIYRDHNKQLQAKISKYGQALSSNIKKKWKYTNPYWR
jgi:hypothetical protein